MDGLRPALIDVNCTSPPPGSSSNGGANATSERGGLRRLGALQGEPAISGGLKWRCSWRSIEIRGGEREQAARCIKPHQQLRLNLHRPKDGRGGQIAPAEALFLVVR